jgi:hypothetical protein
LIPIGIRQNDADPTRSGSTTLESTVDNTPVAAYSFSFDADPYWHFKKNFKTDQRFRGRKKKITLVYVEGSYVEQDSSYYDSRHVPL